MSRTNKDKTSEMAAEAAQEPVQIPEVSTPAPDAPDGTEAALGGQEAQETEKHEDAPALPVANVINAPCGLNLRCGPGLLFDVRAVLSNGDQVELVPIPEEVAVPGWQPVCCGDEYGWVCADFLDEPEAASEPEV